MRKLGYRLPNGTVVYDFAVAKAYGRNYETVLEKVNPEPFTLSPIRKLMLEKFGFAHKSLRDKV